MIAGRLRTDRVVVCGFVLTCLLALVVAAPGGSGQAGLGPQTTEGNSKSAEPSDALRRLQLERHRVLKDVVAQFGWMAEQGREDTAGLRDFTVAMFHAEADLADNPAERMKVYERLVEFLRDHEKHVERMATAGRVPTVEVSKAKIVSLEAQIVLERQRLAQQAAR